MISAADLYGCWPCAASSAVARFEGPRVEIPQVMVALYPSFPLQVLTEPAGYSAVLAALRWFAEQLGR